ncbi:unnamed protein product [Coregonus sp. 'balchen']|nr:unnamed protein product [Coregonus sp. 'balchen']
MVVVKPKPDATPASGIRSTLYKGYSGELPDPSTLNPLPAYADMEPDSLPLICRMNITSDKPLVDSIFGKVQTGSILSYQHPPPPPDSVVIHEDAPPFPKVPLDGYHLQPTDCSYEIMTDQEKLHLSSLSVTLSQSHLIEEATRCQSETPKWHSLRKERVTASHFWEVSHVRGTSTAEKPAERIIRGTRQTPLMKRGLEMEAVHSAMEIFVLCPSTPCSKTTFHQQKEQNDSGGWMGDTGTYDNTGGRRWPRSHRVLAGWLDQSPDTYPLPPLPPARLSNLNDLSPSLSQAPDRGLRLGLELRLGLRAEARCGLRLWAEAGAEAEAGAVG